VNKIGSNGIFTIDGAVPIPVTASTALPASSAADEAAPDRPCSPVEEEVVALFDQLRDRLLRYLIRFGSPPPDGEEIIQDVFISLFQHLRQGKSRRNLTGWLFRVAHNMALKRRYGKRADFEVLTDPIAAGNLVVDPAPNAEDLLANRQVQQRLQAILSALPEQDRRCLSLRAEGLRYREIAEVLGMSLGAVSLSLTRSLARMSRARER